MMRAVVFAYHSVGVRCLQVLLAHPITIALIVTHEDAATENIWFDPVTQYAQWHDIPVITPADPNHPEVVRQIQQAAPDFLFSFYYRQLLGAPLLAIPTRGAYNMHGSLLPKYRGRAPVNWAVLHGETETGATLHEMHLAADAGPIIDQTAVPILPNDTAYDVFQKVTVAAEITLHRALPKLLAGTAHPMPPSPLGPIFGRRTAHDGKIDWQRGADTVHNLVRAVSRPYPGATTQIAAQPLTIWRTRHAGTALGDGTRLYPIGQRLYVDLIDGRRLEILEFETPGATNITEWHAQFGDARVPVH